MMRVVTRKENGNQEKEVSNGEEGVQPANHPRLHHHLPPPRPPLLVHQIPQAQVIHPPHLLHHLHVPQELPARHRSRHHQIQPSRRVLYLTVGIESPHLVVIENVHPGGKDEQPLDTPLNLPPHHLPPHLQRPLGRENQIHPTHHPLDHHALAIHLHHLPPQLEERVIVVSA